MGRVAEKKMRKIGATVLITILFLTGRVGKGVVDGREFSLPDFSFPQIVEVFKDNDFDPRNTKGQIPVSLEEAKNTLRQIFYSGLAETLKNRQLPSIAQTLKQIDKVLDLAGKVIRYPLFVFRFPFVPAVLPTLKESVKKLLRLINQATTFITLSPYLPAVALAKAGYLFTFLLFSFSLLSLSTIILRL